MLPFLKTSLLLACIAALGAAGGMVVAGWPAAWPGAAGAGLLGLVALFASGPLLLRLYGARRADETQAPQLVQLVRDLAARAGVPAPQVWLIDDAACAALSTGGRPGRCAVVLSTGLLALLSERELRAVVAHELAHIRRGDVHAAALGTMLSGMLLTLSMAALGAGLIDGDEEQDGSGGSWLLWLLAPLAALPLWLAAGRDREFEADRQGANICGDGAALADALYKLEHAASPPLALRHPQAAAVLIVAPKGAQGWRRRLVRHPPTTERIARLRAGK